MLRESFYEKIREDLVGDCEIDDQGTKDQGDHQGTQGPKDQGEMCI